MKLLLFVALLASTFGAFADTPDQTFTEYRYTFWFVNPYQSFGALKTICDSKDVVRVRLESQNAAYYNCINDPHRYRCVLAINGHLTYNGMFSDEILDELNLEDHKETAQVPYGCRGEATAYGYSDQFSNR